MRYEKIITTVTETADEGAHEAACDVAQFINKCIKEQASCAAATGSGRSAHRAPG